MRFQHIKLGAQQPGWHFSAPAVLSPVVYWQGDSEASAPVPDISSLAPLSSYNAASAPQDPGQQGDQQYAQQSTQGFRASGGLTGLAKLSRARQQPSLAQSCPRWVRFASYRRQSSS